jgi:ankyrin repeat protein
MDTPQISDHIDINEKDRLGATVLHYLATVTTPDIPGIFEKLVSKGGNVTIKDKEQSSIIHYAIRHKNVRLKF